MAAFFSSPVLPRALRVLDRVLRRHTPDAHIVGHVVALDALGWRVIELRPSFIDGEVSLWRVTAERVDLDASMSMTAADPAGALAELVRYASADTAGAR